MNKIIDPLHWQGQPAGSGTPVHSLKILSHASKIYEFGTPAGVTYPLWYDLPYWFEGLTANFSLKEQVRVLKAVPKILVVNFQRFGFLTAALLFYILGYWRRPLTNDTT